MPTKLTRRRRKQKTKTPTSEEGLAEALKNSCGLQASAGRMVGISQSAVSQRISSSPYLQGVVKEVKEQFLDICETELRKHIYKGNLVALIFYLKTQGKHRGFNEKQELEIDANIRGGVLLVPGMASSSEAWAEQRNERISAETKQKTLTAGDSDYEKINR
jgi:hypothetical protein